MIIKVVDSEEAKGLTKPQQVGPLYKGDYKFGWFRTGAIYAIPTSPEELYDFPFKNHFGYEASDWFYLVGSTVDNLRIVPIWS